MTARNILKRLLLLAGGAILLVGCVRDDRSECRYPLPLRFTYAYNTEQEDLFDAEVTNLDLFLYDAESGRLVARVSPAVETLSPTNGYEWMVAPGLYDVVAWGGVAQRYHYERPDLFSTARLSVNCESDDETVLQRREHLFHARARRVRVTGDLLSEQVLDLHKNSNDVRVEVTGLTEEQSRRLQCIISGKNGDYGFDNRCLEQRTVSYQPEAGYADGMATYDYTVLSLWAGDSSWLHVELPGDGTGRATPMTIFDGSLSELLLQKPGTDLDLEDEFTVRLEAKQTSDGSVDVEIYVNDWHVVDMSGGLG